MTNPFGDIFGSQPPPAQASGAFDDIFSSDVQEQSDEERRRQAIARLKAIKPANEQHRQRIEKLIDQYETHGHSAASNLVRGIGAGVVRAIPRMASTLNQLTGQEDPELERIQKIDEFFDQGGKAGAVGGFIGELAGSGPAYGKIVNTTAKTMAAVSPKFAEMLLKVAKPGASLARHAATNVAVGLPINVAQALGTPDIPIPDDATPEEASEIRSENRKNVLYNIGFGIVADAIFGAAPEGLSRKFGKKAPDAPAEPPTNPNREQELAEISAKRKEREAARTDREKMHRLAAAEWSLANPNKRWRKDLTKEERTRIIADYTERVKRDQAVVAEGQSSKPGEAGASGDEVKAPSGEAEVTGLTAGLGKAGSAIVDNMYQMLADKLAKGDLTEAGTPSRFLIEANKRGLKTVEELKAFVNGEYKAIMQADPENKQYQNVRPEVQEAITNAQATRKAAAIDYAFRKIMDEVDPEKVNAQKLYSEVEQAFATGKDADEVAKLLADIQSAYTNLDASEHLLEGNQLATVRTPDGKIFSGATHADAITKARKAGFTENLEDGFATNKRPFVTRQEAEVLDARDGNYEPSGEGLHTNRVLTDEEISRHADAGFNEAEANKPPFVQTPENAAKQEEYRQILELEQALGRVRDAGGLQTPEEWDAMVKEIEMLRKKNLDQDSYMAELESIIDDFMPATEEEVLHHRMEAEKTDTEQTPIADEGEFEFVRAQIRTLAKEAKETSDPQEINNLAEQVNRLARRASEYITRTGRKSDLEQLAARIGKIGEQNSNTIDNLIRESGAAPPSTETILPSGEEPSLNTTNQPEAQPIPTSPPPPQGGDFLETVTHKKPLAELTEAQLDRLDDKVLDIASDESLDAMEREAATRDLERIGDLRRMRYEAKKAAGLLEPDRPPEMVSELPPISSNVTGAEIVTTVDADAPVKYTEDEFQNLLGKSIKKMSDVDLQTHIQQLQDKINTLPKARRTQLQDRLNLALEVRAERFLSGGFKAELPPTLGGGLAGFVGGLFAPADSDEDRINNAFIGAAAGLAGGFALKRYQNSVRGVIEKPRSPDELPGGQWQAEVGQHVVTGYQKPQRQRSFLEKMREIYFNTIKRSYVGERFVVSIGAQNLATPRNPAKQMAMFGRWTAQTENALREGPSIVDEFGNAQHLGVEGPGDILDMVGGDVQTLGELMAARTKVELGDTVKTPFDIVAAENFFRRAPEVFHRAADRARQFSLALADVAVNGGLLSQSARDAFANETMYASLQRIFKYDSYASTINAEPSRSEVVGAATPLKQRTGGSKQDIRNPFESMVEMIPRIYRAAELNKIKLSFLDAWEAAGRPAEGGIRRISKNELANTKQHEQLVQAIRQEMKLGADDANALVAALDPAALDVERGTMRIFRNGVVESYKIPPDLARGLLSLNPDELSMVWKIMGVPARTASAGVVYNPFFVAKMAFFDAFQATANSAFGFRFGIDNMRGWWNVVNRSEKYQKLLAAGLSHQALAGGNLASIKTTTEALRQQAGTPLEVAVRHIKEARPIEFYKALIGPIADAARVGEALRALDHGASHLDAVFAAKHVTGNYSEIGAWQGMRALQHMTMFLGPALQVLDTAAYRAGVHPFRVSAEGRLKDMWRYAWKMGTMIGLPTWYLWSKAESENDDEIRQMRTTELGRRYWFYRLNWDVPGFGSAGEIVKIPKPILDGQIFGTTMEMALDRRKQEDPSSVAELIKGIGKDAMFNFLPSIGVIPLTLATNTDPTTGWKITPEGSADLSTEHQGEDRASWLSRMISRRVGPAADELNWGVLQRTLSPAGLDYLFNAVGGMLGRDAVIAVSAALEHQDTGYVPAKYEWPVVRQVFAETPSRQTHEIQEFYRRADRVETVGRTMSHLIKEDPERLLAYMESHQSDYGLVKVYSKTRSQIAGLRRAINDLREMHTDIVSSKDRRDIIAEYIRQMNLIAQQANDAARMMP